MRRSTAVAAFVAGSFAFASCGGIAPKGASSPGARDTSAAEKAVSPEPPLPAGWRWEGFAGVLVGVPGDWGWGGSGELDQWCVREGVRSAFVARPVWFSTAVACPERPDGVDPSTLIENTGVVAAFFWRIDPHEPDSGAEGDQAWRRVGDVVVRVNAPPGLRKRILATAHEADIDPNGCPMHLPVGFAPGDPPVVVRDVETLTGVTALAACRYSTPFPGATPKRGMPLLTSRQLAGAAAEKVVHAVAIAPGGGGPNKPTSCSADFAYGPDMLVVFIESDQGRSAVNVHYSGCDHNGIDDGVTLRALTRDAMQPLIADPNTPISYIGTETMGQILDD